MTCSVLDALAIGQAVCRGEAELLGPVVFHRDALNVTIQWRPLHTTADDLLTHQRTRLADRLRARLKELEQKPLEGFSEEETDRLSEQYSRYRMILEVSLNGNHEMPVPSV